MLIPVRSVGRPYQFIPVPGNPFKRVKSYKEVFYEMSTLRKVR